ncbi:ribonuclease J [Herbinix hemicellulosilytica]|uniref:Ribonuclease J n=1 Tax=Herbinix hemicellulosilytica TaxID=1564487 RepID=A0A0H5SFK9_HERHM|nr:ribonuclease J [Herbinix hemicellulosilytica]RBP60096.1 ribonuclease J [Herbinix hemicellulosilytica]CRZ33820.1 Ribonuclease J 1 [Herbinix hemicellulosilytica]
MKEKETLTVIKDRKTAGIRKNINNTANIANGKSTAKRSISNGNGKTSSLTNSIESSVKTDNKKTGGLKIIPLGGLEKIGMNITAIEYDDTIVVIDCGLSFPEDDMLGIDFIIPDVTYLKENIEKVKGFVITHGHEDHIGALPYILKEINVPVYATKLTTAIIENKLKEHNLLKGTKRKVVKYGQSINLGCFRIEFVRTNHSIADSAALAIFTPAGIIFHTGDFKIDYTPVFGEPIDLQRIGEIGKKGVLALLCDSTNAERPGYTMSESTVGKTFDSIFADHYMQRIIVATFASNVDRVQQIVNSAVKYGRKVVIEGRSMVNIVTTASELGYINIPDGVLIDIEHMKNYTDDQLVVITTGSQGESMAALSRMAASIHKKITIKPGDVVILSSTPIPGNEKSVSRVINELSMKGAKVIYQDTHVSGHACQEEIKLIYALTKPKYAIPVHGEYRHLIRHAEIAQMMGVSKDNIFLLSSGDVLTITEEKAEVTGEVTAQGILVDGLGVGDVGNIVLRDRQMLSENGLIIVVISLERGSNQVLAGPDIVSRGFVYVRESENLMEEAKEVVRIALDRCLTRYITDWSRIKTEIKDSLSDFIWKKTKRTPMILPIIMEIE